MKITRDGNMEVIDMTVLEQIDDILKRLYTIENILLSLTPVIDMAYEYEDKLATLTMDVNNLRRKSMSKKPKKKAAKVKMPKAAGVRKAKR